MSDITKILPVEKLIDVFASGIGSVTGHLLLPYKAWMQAKADKIEAKGKAEAMKITAQGTADSTELIAQAQFKVRDMLLQRQSSVSTLQKTNIEMDTAKLIQTKVQFQEEKRLNNLRNIFVQARNKLPEYVNSKPVDPDWIARCFQNAQDVSTEEMQQMWSSILAGEVETPGRTSLRTLDILKNMTKKEAELFNEVMKYKINDFIFRDRVHPPHGDILFLGEIGLLQEHTNLNSQFVFMNDHYIGEYWDYVLILQKEIRIPAFRLTRPAIELASFLYHSADCDYLRRLSQFFKERGCQLYKAKITERRGLLDFSYEEPQIVGS